MNNINNNCNNKTSLFINEGISGNNLSQNENNDINEDELEEFKLIFRKYIAKQKKNKNKNFFQNKNDILSDSDSDLENFVDIYNELNSLYLKCYKNLNQFLKENKNLKGVKLEGNKSLKNLSLDQFNKIFSQNEKYLEQKLKTHELIFHNPNINKRQLNSKKIPLTPIPIKNQRYLKNNAERKDYKNAERAAVLMRRLEYTHGFSNKKINEEKMIFYLLKGAVLIIEDWWIKIKNKNKQNLIGNKKNMDYNFNKNNDNEFNNEIMRKIK